jgi:MoxR-like ATPase
MTRSNVTAIGSGKASAVAAAVPTASAPLSGMAALCDALDGTFAERTTVIRALARAVVAGEHAFLLGKPGTAKSLIVRCFAQALGLSYWEYLLTRFTTPEEVFGPLSIKGLQNDQYTRATRNGYLPGAQLAFADEIFKANSGILNALLTILNERVFHDDGRPTAVPLVSLVGASNELPESESELSALYDRFLVRVETQYVEDRGAFKSMLFGVRPTVPVVPVDLFAEQKAARAVTLPDDVQEAIVTLRYRARDAGLQVSDRRWIQCIALIRAAAHLEGRTVASTDDLECLEDVLWRTPEERTGVVRLIQEVANPSAAKAVSDLDSAKQLVASLPVLDARDPSGSTHFLGKAASVNKDLKDVAVRLAGYPDSRKVIQARAEVAALCKSLQKQTMRAAGLPVDDDE